MDDTQLIVLKGYDVVDMGWYLGFGAVGGGFSAVGVCLIVMWAWELALKKYEKRKKASEGK